MKGLIRNAGETVLETAGIDGIDWATGAPLTNESWCGGAYALAADCPPDAEPSDFDITEETITLQEATEEEPAVTTVRRIATLDAARYEARRAAQAAEPEPIPDPVPEVPAEAPEEAPAEDSGEIIEETPDEDTEPIPETIADEAAEADAPETEALPDDEEIVVLNGVQYTKAQLRAILEGSQ